jgi:hypothetical protein
MRASAFEDTPVRHFRTLPLKPLRKRVFAKRDRSQFNEAGVGQVLEGVMAQITQLLDRMRAGDAAARDALFATAGSAKSRQSLTLPGFLQTGHCPLDVRSPPEGPFMQPVL